MPTFFWIDFIFLIISLIITPSLTLIVIGPVPRRQINRLFAAFSFTLLIWICSAIMLRLSLWLGPLLPNIINLQYPSIWLKLTGLSMGIVAFFSFHFTATYLRCFNKTVSIALIIGIFLLIVYGILIFNFDIFSNPRIESTGMISEDIHPLGILGALILIVYMGWSFILFFKAGITKIEFLLPFSFFLLLMGMLLGGPLDAPFPSMTVTNTTCVILLSYTIIRRQLLNPLKERTIELQKEIETRISIENKLQSTIEEKELLLKEVHHRVKNNLQIIVSLLKLQSRGKKNKQVNQLFTECSNRVRSIALVHEQLYKTKDFTNINFEQYMRTMIKNLIYSYGKRIDNFNLNLELESFKLSIDYAVPCGLIINELVTNALKHGFPPNSQPNPRLDVVLKKSKNLISLTIKDNGKGILNFDQTAIDHGKTMGFYLVKILVEDQLEGKWSISTTKGTHIQIQFPIK